VAQRIEEIAGAVPGVAGRKDAAAMFCMDTAANHFSSMQNATVGHRTTKWRTQSDNRSDIGWTLRGHGARNDASQAMADQMDLASGLGQGLLDGGVELSLDQEVGALRVETYAGKKGFVSNSGEPLMQGCQISIWAEKSREENHSGAIAVLYS
jgi:hypothetical protein